MAKKDKFDYFKCFEKQSEIAIEEAKLLEEFIESFTSAAEMKPLLERAHEIEHRGDALSHEVMKNVAADFITPIEREDLIELAQQLDNITDYIEDVMVCMYIYDVRFIHKDTKIFAEHITKSCEALNRCMGDFRNFKKSKDFKKLIIEVNDHEEAADAQYIETIRHLYTTDGDNPMRVMTWSKVFERMEKCCDACEHVADSMDTIVVKNS